MTKTIRLDKVIYLGSSEQETLASKQSATRAEVYAAATTGLKPSVVFTIWASEYNGEGTLHHEGIKHKIIRTFEPDDRFIELYCEVRLGG